MQKCKYLEDLGLKVTEYGTNFTSDDDPREECWSKEREKYGFDNRETWNLDWIFIEWIYTRVKMYKEIASEVVNLNYYKIPYKDTELTQLEAIDKILELAKEILLNKSDDELRYNNSREICEIWKEILPCMWW